MRPYHPSDGGASLGRELTTEEVVKRAATLANFRGQAMKGWIKFGKDETINFGFGGLMDQRKPDGEAVDFEVETVLFWSQRVEPAIGSPIGECEDKDHWAQHRAEVIDGEQPRRVGVYLGRKLVLLANLRTEGK